MTRTVEDPHSSRLAIRALSTSPTTDPSFGLVIDQLLRMVAMPEDIEEYMGVYSGLQSHKFAVIKVTGEVVRDDMEGFCSALTFMHRAGLFPIVVNGAASQLSVALDEQGIKPTFVDGLRVTDPSTLKTARRVFTQLNLSLCTRLMQMGTPARPVISGVFTAEKSKNERLGFVGDVQEVCTEGIVAAIAAGCIPVVAPLAESATGQILNISSDVAFRKLVVAIQPRKALIVNQDGGWMGQDGNKIKVIDLNSDYERMLTEKYEDERQLLLLKEMKLILDHLPPSSSISLTSAPGLLQELFTTQGMGTRVLKGEKIEQFESFQKAGLTRAEFNQLIQNSMGKVDRAGCEESRELTEGQWAKLSHSVVGIFMTPTRSVCAVLTRGVCGALCLEEFACTTQAKADGTRRAVWDRMVDTFPKLYWTSLTSCKEESRWFFSRSSGSHCSADTGRWTAFWNGMEFMEVDACMNILRASGAMQ